MAHRAELVDVVTESTGVTTAYPDFTYHEFEVGVDYVNSGTVRRRRQPASRSACWH